MAEIHVLILQQDVRESVDDWTERDDSPLNIEKWAKNSSAWPERLLEDKTEPMEVFICLDRELLAEGFDLPFLHRVIQQAHRSMWAAKVYVVVDRMWQPDEERDPEQPDPFLWAKTLLENKVNDILQWSLTPSSNYSEAARRSRTRMEALPASPPGKFWKCLFRTPLTPSREEEYLLAPDMINSLGELGDDSCLIVLRPTGDNYWEYVEKMLEQAAGRQVMIGFVDPVLKPPSELERVCRKKKCGLVWFHGMAELYYFLRRLNSLRENDLRLMNETQATPVNVGANPRFRSNSQQLLITYAHVAGEYESCLAAARDTYELTKDLPADVRVKIYPAIKSAKLADILKDLGRVLAWVHLGHGHEEKGLQEAQDELFKSAEEWLKSFADYESSLALAIFSSCYSTTVARRFAEAGTGVAIGFARRVHQRTCVELTKRVVEAAVNSNGERTAVLKAFRAGREVLELDDRDASPEAFWANH